MASKSKEIAESTLFGEDGFMSRAALDSFEFSPENVQAFLTDLGISSDDLTFKSSEYELVAKDDLVDVPLFLVEWETKPSEQFGGLYTIVRAITMTDDQRKVVFADGGSGISQQLQGVTEKREAAGLTAAALYHGLNVPNGLVRSDYEAHKNPAGEQIPAGTTYYLG